MFLVILWWLMLILLLTLPGFYILPGSVHVLNSVTCVKLTTEHVFIILCNRCWKEIGISEQPVTLIQQCPITSTLWSSWCVKQQLSHLGSIHTDDAIGIPGGVIVVGHTDSTLTSRNPVFLGVWIYLEYMCLRCEDRLFPAIHKSICLINQLYHTYTQNA